MTLLLAGPMPNVATWSAEPRVSRAAEIVPAPPGTPDIDALYRTYRAVVFRIAVRILADADDADDAVQDIFLKLHCHPTLFDPAVGPFDHWVARVTRNYCLDVLRRKASIVRRTIHMHALWEDDACLLSVEEDVWYAQRARALRTAVITLKETHRQVLQLAYGRGLSQSQIATMTGVPLGTVKTRVGEAKARLRVVLAQNPLFCRVQRGATVCVQRRLFGGQHSLLIAVLFRRGRNSSGTMAVFYRFRPRKMPDGAL